MGKKKRRIAGIAVVRGYFGPDRVPILSAVKKWSDHTEFDRRICASGLKQFLRPVMESDWHFDPARALPNGAPPPEGRDIDNAIRAGHVLVVEEVEGVRVRFAVSLATFTN